MSLDRDELNKRRQEREVRRKRRQRAMYFRLILAAVVLIAAFILLRDRRMKKAAAAQEYAPTHAVATTPFIAAETQADETEIPAPAETPAQRSPWDNV